MKQIDLYDLNFYKAKEITNVEYQDWIYIYLSQCGKLEKFGKEICEGIWKICARV